MGASLICRAAVGLPRYRVPQHWGRQLGGTLGEQVAHLGMVLSDQYQAMKAARVDMCAFYGPPSPTNFGGALLTGSQSDCEAACEAFARAVIEIARNPIEGLFTL